MLMKNLVMIYCDINYFNFLIHTTSGKCCFLDLMFFDLFYKKNENVRTSAKASFEA